MFSVAQLLVFLSSLLIVLLGLLAIRSHTSVRRIEALTEAERARVERERFEIDLYNVVSSDASPAGARYIASRLLFNRGLPVVGTDYDLSDHFRDLNLEMGEDAGMVKRDDILRMELERSNTLASQARIDFVISCVVLMGLFLIVLAFGAVLAGGLGLI